MGPFATEWIPEIRVRGYSEHSAQVLSRQGRLCGHKRSPRPVHGLSYSITSSRRLNEIGCEAAGNGVSHRTAWWGWKDSNLQPVRYVYGAARGSAARRLQYCRI